MELLRMPGHDKVYYFDCFPKEFKEATNGEDRYRQWLARSLYILESKGKGAIILNQFEMLSTGSVQLYSIRYPKSKLNPRVIYFYLEDDNIILVTAFKEKSNSDYKRGIRRAEERYTYISQGE